MLYLESCDVNLFRLAFSLSIIPFKSFPSCVHDLFISCLLLCSIPWQRYTRVCLTIHPPRILDCFQFGAIANKAAMYIHVLVFESTSLHFSGINVQEFNYWSHYNCMLGFISNYPTIGQSCCIMLHFHQFTPDLPFPHPFQHFILPLKSFSHSTGYIVI